MKKLLLGTIVLLAFNAAIIITQMSCKKEAQAESPTPGGPALKQLNVVLYSKITSGTNRVYEYWMTNLDTGQKRKIPVTLPDGKFPGDEATLTPDGLTLIFDTSIKGTDGSTKDGGIYSCKLDGSNLKMIVDPNPDGYHTLLGAY